MSGNIGEKARAAFLALIMVTSVMMAGVAFSGSAAAQQQTNPTDEVVVDQDPSTGDYNSIQAAVNNEGSDTLITVNAGTYNETVDIGESGGIDNVTIQGAGVGNSIINGTDGTRAIQIGAIDGGGNVQASNVSISGFTIYQNTTGNFAIETTTSTSDENITIADNKIVANGSKDGVGAYLPTATNVRIADNEFAVEGGSAREHIATDSGSQQFTIEGNTFEGDITRSGEGNAVEVRGTDFTVQNNDFSAVSTDGAIVADISGDLDLSAVLSSNTFDRTVTVEDSSGTLTSGIYGSIQPAVDAASSGDTVTVGPGTYEESIVIDGTNSLTLQGVEDANGNSPVIVGDGANVGSQPHAAIHVDGNGPTQETTIEEFTIRNPDGHYGVYAGTGGSNSDVDGFVLRNNTIEDIATNISSHNALAGSVAGLYVRAQYDSITVEDNTIRNVNTKGDNFQNAAGLSFSSFIGDEAFADTDRGSETAENTSVQNNVVTNITGAEGSRTKGISVSGEFDGLTIANNTVTAVSANITDSNILAITLTENPPKNGSDIDSDGTNERIGPRNFEIRDNDIDELSGADEALVFVGGYEDLGDNHVVEDNNFLDTDAGVSRFAQNQKGFNPGDEDTLDATSNWWGAASGPDSVGPGSGSNVSDNVDYAPWLDAADGDETPGDVTVNQVTVGASDTIEIPIDNYPTGSVADFNVTAADGTEIQSGSTNGEPISVTADYDQNGNYTLNLKFGGDGNLSATAVRGTYDTNLTLTPESPVFEDSLTVNGELLEDDGSAGNNVSVELQDENGSTRSSDTTTSTGAFSLGSVTDDAGEWSIVVNGVDTDTVDVGAQDVSLSVEANNTATFEQNSTVTIQLNDSSDNPIDTSNVNGYVNITGPFASVGNTDTGSIQDDQSPEYVRVNTDANGNVTLPLTPNGSDVTVSLENNQGDEIVDGLEDTTIITNDAPDFTADAQSLSVAQLDTLNAQTGTDEISVSQSSQDLTVTVTGGDGLGPAAGNDLVNATVAISGPNVDNETELNGSSDATFPVLPDEAGTITAEVTAFNRSGGDPVEVGPQTVNVSVTGDNFENILPATDPDIDTTTEVGVTVTDTEGTPANVRNVTFEHANTDGFNVTGTDGTATTGKFLNISSTAGSVAVGNTKGSLTAVQTFSPDSGEYLAENVSFDKTGAVNLTVADGGSTTVFVEGALDVTGANVYTVESDIDQALVGLNETHNLSISENGAAVNGSELGNINIKEVEQAGDTSNVATVTAASPADTDDDGTNESLQVELRAENATEPLNITVEEAGESRTGSTSISVVEPEISTTLGGDLTEGVTTESVDITAFDPRDDSELDADQIQFNATNTTFEVDVDGSANISDGEEIENDTDSGFGNVTANITPDAVDDPASLTVSVSIDNSQFYGDTDLTAGELQFFERENRQDIEVNDQLASDFNETVRYNLRDANGERIDERDVAFDENTFTTTNGIISVDYSTVDNGEFDFDVRNDRTEATDITVASINKSEQVALDIEIDGESVENLTVESGEEVDAQLIRTDINDFTSGNLLVEQDGTVEQQISIAGDDGETAQLNVSGGNYDLIGQKDTTENTNFDNDTIDLTVNQDEASVTFNNQSVTNGSETVTVDSANFTRADGSAGDYVVVVHVVNDDEFDGGLDNSISAPVGASGNLSNGAENITVDLNSSAAFEDGDALDSITENVTLRAMLHTTANDSAFGTRLGNAIDGIEPGDETDDANITVEEAAEDAPANFEVSNVTPDGVNVTAGDNITVNADIENVGGQQATQSVEFRIVATDGNTSIDNASATRSQNVTLNASANDTVTFENVSTDGLTAGDFTHGVFSENDSATATITVEEAQQQEPSVSVNFTDQTVPNGTEEVTVDSANFTRANGSAGDYVVVVHTIDEFGAPVGNVSDPIGASGDLTDGEENITVDLTAADGPINSITENVTLRAMLHTTANDSAFGTRLGNAIDGIEPGDETDDANITVEEVAEDAPANFEVSDLEPQDATVNVSEAFDVSATVENTGDLQGEQEIELLTEPEGGSVLNNTTVSLDPGANTTVTFENVTVDTAGEFNHTVASANDSVSGNLTVEEVAEDAPANFEVSGLEPQDATVNVSEAFDVSATVENTGDLQGEQEIELLTEPEGGSVLNNTTVSLDPGANTTVTFENVTVDTAGEFNHTVASANDSVSGNLTVEEVAEDAPANFEVSGLEPQDATVNVSEAFDVSATVENTGDLQGEQEIELLTEPEGGSVLNNTTVSLDPGANTTVTFENVTVDTAGEFNHTVASANDSVSGSLTVEEAAENVTVGDQEVPVRFTTETENGDRTVTADNAVDAINTFLDDGISADVAVDVINAFLES